MSTRSLTFVLAVHIIPRHSTTNLVFFTSVYFWLKSIHVVIYTQTISSCISLTWTNSLCLTVDRSVRSGSPVSFDRSSRSFPVSEKLCGSLVFSQISATLGMRSRVSAADGYWSATAGSERTWGGWSRWEWTGEDRTSSGWRSLRRRPWRPACCAAAVSPIRRCTQPSTRTTSSSCWTAQTAASRCSTQISASSESWWPPATRLGSASRTREGSA